MFEYKEKTQGVCSNLKSRIAAWFCCCSNAQRVDKTFAFQFEEDEVPLMLPKADKDKSGAQLWRSLFDQSVALQSDLIQENYSKVAQNHYVLRYYKQLLAEALHKDAEAVAVLDAMPEVLKKLLDQTLEYKGEHPILSKSSGLFL